MKKSALQLAIAAAALASTGAMAATNPGTASAPTSVGDFIVSVSVGSVVLISNLDDVDLGNWTAVDLNNAGGTSQTETACVYASAGPYQVQLESLNGIIGLGGSDYAAATPPNAGQLFAAPVAPGGNAFAAPGDPVLQAAADGNSNGICEPLPNPAAETCVTDVDGQLAVGAIPASPGTAMSAEVFRMSGGVLGVIDYSITWNGNVVDGSPILDTGSASLTCNGTDNVSMVVGLAPGALGGMGDGYYSDTVTVTITAL